MTVIDLGCYDPPNSGFSSIGSLIERFHPETLIGFDLLADDREYELAGTQVRTKKAAAYIEDGQTTYIPDGTESALGDGGTNIDCFDFSAWLASHGPAIVKMDIEGAEYPLLEKMRQDGTDKLIELLIVEWHDDPLTDLACPIMAWWN